MVLPIGLGASAAAGAGNPSPPPNDGKQTNPQNTGQWRRGVELPSVPVVKYVRANKYPTYSVRSANGVCDIPSSAIDVCGNAIAIQGSNITTFYDNDGECIPSYLFDVRSHITQHGIGVFSFFSFGREVLSSLTML